MPNTSNPTRPEQWTELAEDTTRLLVRTLGLLATREALTKRRKAIFQEFIAEARTFVDNVRDLRGG